MLTENHHAKQTIQDLLEAEEDYSLAISRLEKNRPGVPLEEVERLLGLESLVRRERRPRTEGTRARGAAEDRPLFL